MIYTYSIVDDFPNKKIDMGSFIEQLKENNIPIDNLVIQGDNVKVITLLNLTSEQETIVDTVISNHSGVEIREIHTDQVKIVEEQADSVTQGNFQSRTIDVYVNSGDTIVHTDISYPFAISLFSSEWLVSEDIIGDVCEFQVSPDTVCGVLIAPHSSGDTILSVSDTVFTDADMKLGYYISINGQDLGRVIDMNISNSTITIENPLETDLAAMTYVLFTVKVVPHWRFNAVGFCSVGESKIGASYIPANTVFRIVYHNVNDVKTNKLFGISIDYLY